MFKKPNHMNNIRLLIADDHHLFLDGIVSLLLTEKAFAIDTANDGYEVLEKVSKSEYDVCLLDIGMPRLDGIATAKALKEKKSPLKIIILSTYNDKEIVSEMMKVGVAGYLLKNCSKQELVEAIQKVAEGGKHFSEEVQNTIVNQFTTYLTQQKNKAESILTPREIEIVQLLAKEFTNEKIANQLNISYRTVETHRKNIMQKTKSHNLAGLLKFAYEQGLTT
jgi:DNA-binding NarL/FixJ family response regulator